MVTPEEGRYLEREKKEDPADLRRTGAILNLIGRVGQYVSLFYGVYSVSGENPSIFGAITGGIGYGAFGLVEYSANLFGFKAEGTRFLNELQDSEKKVIAQLDHIERIKKGRVIGVTIKDPITGLDCLVAEDLRKEGIDLKTDLEDEKRNQKLGEEIIAKKSDSDDTKKIVRGS